MVQGIPAAKLSGDAVCAEFHGTGKFDTGIAATKEDETQGDNSEVPSASHPTLSQQGLS